MAEWTFVLSVVAQGKIVEELRHFDNFEAAKDLLRIYNKKYYHLARFECQQTFVIVAKRK
jgi:hypothetical protein